MFNKPKIPVALRSALQQRRLRRARRDLALLRVRPQRAGTPPLPQA